MVPDDEPAQKPRVKTALRQFRAAVWPDAGRAATLFFTAFAIGVVYVSTWGGQPEFWQQIFGPSVMTACGRGFTNPDVAQVPGLEDFLYLRSGSFDCASFPADVAVLPEDHDGMDYDAVQAFHPEPQFPGWTQWQRFHRYLLLSAALMFYLFGVAWQSLLPLYGLLYGATNALAYGIFRLGMGRRMATLGGVLLMTAPAHLQQLPQLRDYSKAPFFFLVILAAGWILKRPRAMAIQLPLAGLAGLAAGFGIGFRQDISIAAGMFCVLVALFLPGGFKKTAWKRAAVVAIFLGASAIPGTPIIRVLAQVNNATHDTIIGFTHYCDGRLGVEAPLYDFGDPFLDEYVRAMVMGYAYRTEGRTEVFRHYSAPYDKAGKAYFREMLYTFPADLIIRGYASILRIVDEMQVSSPNGAPRGVTNQFLARLFQWRQGALELLPGGGRYQVAAMLLILAAVNLRLGFATFLGILVFAGYPALRFSERHAFHMQIVALFALLFLVYWFLQAGRAAWSHRREFKAAPFFLAARGYAARGLLFATAAAVLLALPLYGARAWQSGHVESLLEQYEAADRTLLVQHATARDDNTTFVAVPGLTQHAGSPGGEIARAMYTEVIVLAFAPGNEPIHVTFDFKAGHPNFQFDRTMTVPAAGTAPKGLTRLYYPVYFGPDVEFLGFTLPTGAYAQLEAAYRINDLTPIMILLNAVLPPDWRSEPRYQSFSR